DGIRDKLVTGVQTCALPIYDVIDVLDVHWTLLHARPARDAVPDHLVLDDARVQRLGDGGIPVDSGRSGRIGGDEPGPDLEQVVRSEERRVGKEGRGRVARDG